MSVTLSGLCLKCKYQEKCENRERVKLMLDILDMRVDVTECLAFESEEEQGGG